MPRSYLGTGFKYPLRINPRGGFSFSSDEQDVEEAIWIILSTAKGERQMLPNFGCGMHELVFAPNNPATRGLVAHQVRQALIDFEPRVDVVEVRVESSADDPNLILIRLDYRIRFNNAFHNLVYPFYVNEGTGG